MNVYERRKNLRITEWLRSEGTFAGLLVQLLLKHGLLKPLAQAYIQVTFEYLQRGDPTNSLGNPCQCFVTHMVQKCFLMFHLLYSRLNSSSSLGLSLYERGEATQALFGNTALLCRFRIRNTKAQQELKLARDMKNSKKGAYKYIGRKRKMWAYCSVCKVPNGNIRSKDSQCCFFLGLYQQGFFQVPLSDGRIWSSELLLIVEDRLEDRDRR